MLMRDVLMILAAISLFIFALAPRHHVHGGRRREADNVSDVESGSMPNHWHRYEAEALEDANGRPAFRVSR